MPSPADAELGPSGSTGAPSPAGEGPSEGPSPAGAGEPSPAVANVSPSQQDDDSRSEDSKACDDFLSDPENWVVFPRIGRSLRWSVPDRELRDLAHAFRGHPGPIEEDSGGADIFLRPGLDVKLRVSPRRCKWAGEMRLSKDSGCESFEGDKKAGQKHEEEFVKSFVKETQVFRLSLPKRYALAQIPGRKVGELTSSHLKAPDIQFYFCVKPAPHVPFQPLHFFWYKRDADGMSARQIFSSPIRNLFRGLAFVDSILLDRPLAQELNFNHCSDKRWAEFASAEKNASSAGASAAAHDQLRVAALRALHDDCTTVSAEAYPVEMPAHSAVLLHFVFSPDTPDLQAQGDKAARGEQSSARRAAVVLALAVASALSFI